MFNSVRFEDFADDSDVREKKHLTFFPVFVYLKNYGFSETAQGSIRHIYHFHVTLFLIYNFPVFLMGFIVLLFFFFFQDLERQEEYGNILLCLSV